MRDLIIAGNWKMNKGLTETSDFCHDLRVYAQAHCEPWVRVIIAPPFPFLAAAFQILQDTPVGIAAQNVSTQNDGAFTGEISASMLRSLSLPYCIVGHSERRQYHHETDAMVRVKIQKLLQCDIIPIVCIGETLEQHEAGETQQIVLQQLQDCFDEIAISDPKQVVIAYEPVWAIGTGKNATPEQAQTVHLLIRNWLEQKYGKHISDYMQILYGGSMKPENIQSLLQMPDIDGGLIGGASLKIDQFTAMIESAKEIMSKRR